MECLTYERPEAHGCVLSTVVADALELKYQAICIHSVE